MNQFPANTYRNQDSMAKSGPAPSAPLETPAIPRELNDLTSDIERLAEVIDNLYKRLDSVISHADSKGTAVPTNPNYGVPLADAISVTRIRVNALTMIVMDLRDRLAI
jgi:hypothetical protein